MMSSMGVCEEVVVMSGVWEELILRIEVVEKAARREMAFVVRRKRSMDSVLWMVLCVVLIELFSVSRRGVLCLLG